MYRSLVALFYDSVKKQNIPCIGIVFKNHKLLLDELCDHVIEIDDIEFASTKHNIPGDINNTVPNYSYDKNDGWHPIYIRGLYCKTYEDVILDLNFNNIFYTLHGDGSRLINLYDSINTKIFYKINGKNIIIDTDSNACSFRDCMTLRNKIPKTTKNNKIVIWIRNTNKWPDRNIPYDYYNELFNYCIKHDKICYAYQDLIPVNIPKHPNIIECNINDKFKNRTDLDKFMEICQECDIFIGQDSGSTQMAMQCKNDILIICLKETFIDYKNFITNIKTSEQLVETLNNYYFEPDGKHQNKNKVWNYLLWL